MMTFFFFFSKFLFGVKNLHSSTYFSANLLNNESRFYGICQSAAAKVPLCESTVQRHLGSVCHEEESKL